MVCGPKMTKTRKYAVRDKRIDKLNNFNYLGNIFNNWMNWESLVTARVQYAGRVVEGLFRFACKLGHKPVTELVTLYKAKSGCLRS